MELKEGNKVKIIGPSICGQTKDIGREFVIYQTFTNYQGTRLYTNGQEYNYPANSLRLVKDELKVGELVWVLEQPRNLHGHPTGQIDKIQEMGQTGGVRVGDKWYDVEALRKLTQEEIIQHTQPDWYQCKGCLQMNEMDRRVSEIEKKQNNLENKKLEVNNRIVCPHARFSPHQNSMFCGSEGSNLCHDNLVRLKCPLL